MIIKFIFKLHIMLFKYPCKSNVRLALENLIYVRSLSDRVGMLFICGESIESIADWLYLEKHEVIQILNDLVKESKV